MEDSLVTVNLEEGVDCDVIGDVHVSCSGHKLKVHVAHTLF